MINDASVAGGKVPVEEVYLQEGGEVGASQSRCLQVLISQLLNGKKPFISK